MDRSVIKIHQVHKPAFSTMVICACTKEEQIRNMDLLDPDLKKRCLIIILIREELNQILTPLNIHKMPVQMISDLISNNEQSIRNMIKLTSFREINHALKMAELFISICIRSSQLVLN